MLPLLFGLHPKKAEFLMDGQIGDAKEERVFACLMV
jgi:hypothetical protein